MDYYFLTQYFHEFILLNFNEKTTEIDHSI